MAGAHRGCAARRASSVGLIVRLTVSRGATRILRAGGHGGACASAAVAHSTLPSVVTILTRTASGGSGNGSGEIIRSGGYVLTNEHVIAPAAGGGTVSVLYSDGTSSDATVVGEDALTDLAVVKAEDGAQGRPLIGIGSSSDLKVGQPVVALGAPLGSQQHRHGRHRERAGSLRAGAGGERADRALDRRRSDRRLHQPREQRRRAGRLRRRPGRDQHRDLDGPQRRRPRRRRQRRHRLRDPRRPRGAARRPADQHGQGRPPDVRPPGADDPAERRRPDGAVRHGGRSRGTRRAGWYPARRRHHRSGRTEGAERRRPGGRLVDAQRRRPGSPSRTRGTGLRRPST